MKTIRRQRRLYSTADKSEKKLLKKLYIDQYDSVENIAKELGLSVRSIYNRLKEHGISRVDRHPQQDYCPRCGHQKS